MTTGDLMPRAGAGTEMRESRALVRLLFETAKRHGAFEAADWSSWYAAYTDARQQGRPPEQAAAAVGHGLGAIAA